MPRRQPRNVQISESQETQATKDTSGCPEGYYPNPGFPLFPAEGEQRWIRAGRDPSYVRIYKIIKGQPVLAEWFHGDPNATTADVISSLWGKGTYKVQLMSSATPQRGIERIFQNTIEVDYGDERKPFPGRDRSPKVLANHGDAPLEEDGEADQEGSEEEARELPDRARDDEGEDDEDDAMRAWREQRELRRRARMERTDRSSPASLFGGSLFQQQQQPQQQQQQQPQQQQRSVVDIVTVATPIVTSLMTMMTTMINDRAAREDRMAQQHQAMMVAMLGRGDKMAEKMLEVTAKPSQSIDPHVVETLASIKAELASIKSRGSNNGGDGLDNVEKALALVEKIKGPEAPPPPPAESGGIGAILEKLGPFLPTILAALQQPSPAQPQQQLPPPPPPPQYDPSQGG